jgi:hypothetical protein
VTGARVAAVLAFIVAAAVDASAATLCQLPSVFGLTVEEGPLVGAKAGGLVVVRADARSALLQPGDVIRQANARRTDNCRELEAAAADAAARGVLLLLAAERADGLVAVALADETSAPVAAAPPVRPAPAASGDDAPLVRSAPASPAAVAAAPAPLPTPVATPVPRKEVSLPPRDGASAELTSKSVAAAAVLGTVDEAARMAVPVTAYERRIGDAKNAITALRIEGDGSAAVRDLVAETLAYHETARDIRRYKAAELTDARVDQRGAGAVSLPYFSDSEVPRWIERYPFLSEALQQSPRATHMLLPGEMPGRWNPDQAVELLWERARTSAERLGAWGAGSR